MEITARNVNDAFPAGWDMLQKHGIRRHSRVGTMLEYPGVVTTTYTHPRERVLFHSVRDANPFFHLFESMWMLSGRNDVAWLSRFNKRMEEFSDDGKTLVSAYGMRWNRSLPAGLQQLSRDPDTRRVYLPIYDPQDTSREGRDTPCNLGVDFKIRSRDDKPKSPRVLDMTVFNRSNDMIWGAYGANMVTFSILQEFVANWLGVPMGNYNQVSASFHVYPDRPDVSRLNGVDLRKEKDPYATNKTAPYEEPMVKDKRTWKMELGFWCEYPGDDHDYSNPWFAEVLVPLFRAWRSFKLGENGATVSHLENVAAGDWAEACYQWVDRRLTERAKKEKK